MVIIRFIFKYSQHTYIDVQSKSPFDVSGCCNGFPIPCVSDIPVHPESVLPVARGAARHSVRPRHRHVEPGLHPRRDAHGGAAVRRRQRGESRRVAASISWFTDSWVCCDPCTVITKNIFDYKER